MIKNVVYINLDKRTDRKTKIEKTLSCFPNVQRISAIREFPGWLGATKSHIKALEYAQHNRLDHILIVEDDMEWNNFEIQYPKVQQLMKSYDVILFSGVDVKYDKETNKLFQSNCTGGYLVAGHYYRTLLDNFREGMRLMENELFKRTKAFGLKKHVSVDTLYRIDVWWHSLQRRDNWFIVPMMISEPGFSDVLNREMDYSNLFLKE